MTRYILPMLFSVLLAGATIYVKDRRAHRAAVPAQAAPAAEQVLFVTTDREQAALALLSAIGNPQPSAAILSEVVDWSLAEDGGSDAMSRNNPWNTTMCGFGQARAINGDGACGVGAYPTMEDGIAANAATLGQGNFADVRAALLANDPEAFKTALWASPWAASHYSGGVGWPQYQIEAAPAPPAAPAAPALSVPQFASNPISLAGDCGYNVQVAIDANGGALQHVVIWPGETFSFNASMGSPVAIPFVTCAGVPGGNWCNLAARYAQVARALGLVPQFEDHGVGDLGGGPENSVAIWNVGGQAGSEGESQDLEITNTTSQAVTFQTRVDGDRLIVEGGY